MNYDVLPFAVACVVFSVAAFLLRGLLGRIAFARIRRKSPQYWSRFSVVPMALGLTTAAGVVVGTWR